MNIEQHLIQADDQTLVEMFSSKESTRESQQDAFRVLYDRYAEDVWRYIRSRTRSKEDTDDIFANVWRMVVSKIGGFNWDTDSKVGNRFKAWILSIATLRIAEFYRLDSRGERSISLDDPDPGTQRYINDFLIYLEQVHGSDDVNMQLSAFAQSKLQEAIHCLSATQRKIVILRYYEDMNASEIGHSLDMKPVTVRVNLKRAIDKLRETLNSSMNQNMTLNKANTMSDPEEQADNAPEEESNHSSSSSQLTERNDTDSLSALLDSAPETRSVIDIKGIGMSKDRGNMDDYDSEAVRSLATCT